jgi:hypothetical protein
MDKNTSRSRSKALVFKQTHTGSGFRFFDSLYVYKDSLAGLLFQLLEGTFMLQQSA